VRRDFLHEPKSRIPKKYFRKQAGGEAANFLRVQLAASVWGKRGSIEGLNGETAIFGRYFHCQMGIPAKIFKRLVAGRETVVFLDSF
jgi:hypothetical protein